MVCTAWCWSVCLGGVFWRRDYAVVANPLLPVNFCHRLRLACHSLIEFCPCFFIINKCRNQAPVIKTRNHWHMDHCWWLVYRFEGDLDSDLNRLASGNLRQYATVPSQCDQLPWTWTWRLLYFNHWSHFRSSLVVFSLLRVSIYHYKKGPVWYIFPFYNHYRYSELSMLLLFVILWQTYV